MTPIPFRSPVLPLSVDSGVARVLLAAPAFTATTSRLIRPPRVSGVHAQAQIEHTGRGLALTVRPWNAASVPTHIEGTINPETGEITVGLLLNSRPSPEDVVLVELRTALYPNADLAGAVNLRAIDFLKWTRPSAGMAVLAIPVSTAETLLGGRPSRTLQATPHRVTLSTPPYACDPTLPSGTPTTRESAISALRVFIPRATWEEAELLVRTYEDLNPGWLQRNALTQLRSLAAEWEKLRDPTARG